jgi:hypothetical protein
MYIHLIEAKRRLQIYLHAVVTLSVTIIVVQGL